MQRGEDGLLHLPTNHPYYVQVQGEMAILNVEWCDFVVYSKGTVIVDRIINDFGYWTLLNETLIFMPNMSSQKFCLVQYLNKNIIYNQNIKISLAWGRMEHACMRNVHVHVHKTIIIKNLQVACQS